MEKVFSRQQRVLKSELMDGHDFDLNEFRQTLDELQLINRWTMGYRPTLVALEEVVRRNPGRKLRVLDIGFGQGDMLRAIYHWAKKNQFSIELAGIDLNPMASEVAREMTPAEYGIQYATGNVFDLETSRYDVMINSLFMHHLADDEIVHLLSWMTENSALAWFINDLHRHPIAFHFIKYATRYLSHNRLIKNDAPLSVARSFRAHDWRNYLGQAQVPLSACQIQWHWAFRYGVSCDTVLARQLKTQVGH